MTDQWADKKKTNGRQNEVTDGLPEEQAARLGGFDVGQ